MVWGQHFEKQHKYKNILIIALKFANKKVKVVTDQRRLTENNF